LVAAKVHPDPMPYAHVITSTTHKTLRGPRGAMILCKAEFAAKIDRAVFPGMQGGPLDHVIAAKAIAFQEALQPEFVEYQKQIVKNAKVLAEELQNHGFRLISGGTDTHLMLVDLTPKGVTGKEAETLLDAVGICCNKNMIPFDKRKPMDPSGIRLGTPTLTTRGMKEPEMRVVADLIAQVVDSRGDAAVNETVKKEVAALCAKFPIYMDLHI
jgi:glycine hydroxymethyltransferase